MSKNKGETGQVKPYLPIMCAAFLWASGGTASKYLFNAGMSPYILVRYRVSFSALGIFGYLFLFEKNSLKINAKDLWNLALLGAFGMGGVQVTYLFAISKIKVAMAILLQYLAPFFVAIYSCLFFKERIDRWKALSIFLAFMENGMSMVDYRCLYYIIWNGNPIWFLFYGDRTPEGYSGHYCGNVRANFSRNSFIYSIR